MPLKSCIPPLWGFSEVSLHYRKSTNYQSRETVKELATEVLFQRTMILSSVLFYILGRILRPPPPFPAWYWSKQGGKAITQVL